MGTGGGHGPGANFNLTTVQIVPGRNSRYVIAAAGLIDIYKALSGTLVPGPVPITRQGATATNGNCPEIAAAR